MKPRYNPQAHPSQVVKQFLPDEKDVSACSKLKWIFCVLNLLEKVDGRPWRAEYANPIDDLWDRVREAGVPNNTQSFVKARVCMEDLRRRWTEPRSASIQPRNYAALNVGGKCGCDRKDNCSFRYCFPFPFC